jgi:hypothetical protein
LAKVRDNIYFKKLPNLSPRDMLPMQKTVGTLTGTQMCPMGHLVYYEYFSWDTLILRKYTIGHLFDHEYFPWDINVFHGMLPLY